MIAFICNSPVQVLRAIQMNMRIEAFSSSATLFLCSSFFDKAEIIAENLKAYSNFKNVYLVDDSMMDGQLLYKTVREETEVIKVIKQRNYEKLVSFNVDSRLISLMYNLNRKNLGFEYHCVEDSPNLYGIPEFPNYNWYSREYLMGYRKPYLNIKYWWSSCPDLITIPKSYAASTALLPAINLDDEELLYIFNKVFGYADDEELNSADILIMDESHYQDGLMLDNSDFNLYCKIKERYPKKKIIMKMHPRTRHNRYTGIFTIMRNTFVPWEVYAINRAKQEMKELVQVAISCSTLVSDKLLFDYEGIKFYLGPLFYDKIRRTCEHDSLRVSEEQTNKIKLIREKYRDKNKFIIPNSEAEFFEKLDSVLNIV